MQLNSDLKVEAINTIFDKNNSELTVVIRTNNINNKMLAERIYTYISENYTSAGNIKSINIVLQKSYIVGAVGKVKQHTYSVK